MTTSPDDGAITIYAELLANIRQVSVAVSLATFSDPETRAEVVEGGAAIRVRHGHDAQYLTLPTPAAVSAQLPMPKKPSKSLVWRLTVSSQENTSQPAFSHLDTQAVPWSAGSIRPASDMFCRQCDRRVVQGNTIESWRDLPSEDWAEMMEFWHCHKPHDHQHDETEQEGKLDQEHLSKRGYGASSAITARPGVGFVALTSFMFTETDCEGLSVS